MSTIMLVAGEPSGDLQASRVAAALKELAPDVTLFGMGGDLMEEAGVELIYHIRDSAVMGIGEVFTAIPAFLKKRKHLKHLIRVKRPDAVVLIDFGDFNMPLARFTHRLGDSGHLLHSPQGVGMAPEPCEKDRQDDNRCSVNLPICSGFLSGGWGKCGVCRASVVGLCPNRSEFRGSPSCAWFGRRSPCAWANARQPSPGS